MEPKSGKRVRDLNNGLLSTRLRRSSKRISRMVIATYSKLIIVQSVPLLLFLELILCSKSLFKESGYMKETTVLSPPEWQLISVKKEKDTGSS